MDGNGPQFFISGDYPILNNISIPGIYHVDIDTSYGCTFGKGDITINYYPKLPINDGKNIVLCTALPPPYTFNVDQTATMLGVQQAVDYTVTYYDTSYQDAYDGVPTGIIPNANLTNYVVSGTSKTIWVRFEETAGNGCVTVKPIVINIYPPATATVNSPSVCFGQNATLTATPGAPSTYSYAWTVPSGANPGDVATFQTAIAGNYTVVMTDTVSKCVSAPVTGVVTVNPLPTISGTTTICKGNTTQLTGSGTTAVASPWLTSDFTVATVSATGLVTGVSGGPATITYTDSNGCSNTTLVTVNPTPTITGTTTICELATTQLTGSGTPAVVNPWISSNTAVATVSPTGLVTGVFNGTSTITYTDNNGCFITTLVTVNALPTATISGTTTICAGNTVVVTFTGTPNAIVTYNDGVNPNTTITLNSKGVATVTTPVLLVNTTYSLVSVLNPTTNCSQLQTGTAIITVNPLPTASIVGTATICAGKTTTITFSGTANATVSYTVNGASKTIVLDGTGAATLTTPALVTNTTYALVSVLNTTTNCSKNVVGSAVVTVRPTPVANPVITNYQLCDMNASGDGKEFFTLSTKDTQIKNGQNNVTITYYALQADAIGQINSLSNSSYQNTSNPQKIWINISDDLTACNSVSSFNLVVNPLPTVVAPAPMFACASVGANQAFFDLILNNLTISNSVAGVEVTYYNTLLNAQNKTAPVNSSAYLGTDNETIYVRAENLVTGCYDTTTLLLRVTQGPTANTPTPLQVCDPNNDGVEVFNLNSTINQIVGGALPPGVSVTFHETLVDAQVGGTTIPGATSASYTNILPWNQTVYVRVFYTLTGCYNIVQLPLIVNPTPALVTPTDYHLCDTTGAVGFETFDLTTKKAQILGAINPALVTVTYYTVKADADAGTINNVIATPATYSNTTINSQIVYVRVKTIATGCFKVVALKLIVDPLPLALPSYPEFTMCDYTGAVGFEQFDLSTKVTSILQGQTGMNVTFYPSLLNAQNGTSAINTTKYQNAIANVQTLGIRITNATTGCFITSTMDIRVIPLPTPIPPVAPYAICDTNQDGISVFDLTTLTAGIDPGANYTITYHTEATTTGAPIPTPNNFTNTVPFVQTIYVRAEDPVTHCYSVVTAELDVTPSPITPSLPDLTKCDNDNNPQNQLTFFDFSSQKALVLAAQQSASNNYTVTFYTTLANAQLGAPAINPDTNFMGANAQTIWVRVENNLAGCFAIGSFKLIVNTPMVLIRPAPLSMCDDDANPNDKYHTFDLRLKDVEINQGSGLAVTYYPSLALAQAGVVGTEIVNPNAYTNTSPAVQTLGVSVTNGAGCPGVTTLDIRVLPIPTPNTNPPSLPAKCDDNNPGDMMEVFDLTQNEAIISGGDLNLTFHYFYTQAEAAANQNEIIPATAALVGSDVWIRVQNLVVDYQGNNCYVLVKQPLTVNPLPSLAASIPPYRACDDNTDGFAVFDFSNPALASAILGPNQLPSDYTISYYATAAGANPITNTGQLSLPVNYTNTTPVTQNVYIRVVNNATGCVNPVGVLTLVVEQAAFATGPQSFADCDNFNNLFDGLGQVDLTQFDSAILNGQDPAVFKLSYYHTQADAIAGTNSVSFPQAYETVSNIDTVWVKVENTSNAITPLCYAVTTIAISIQPRPYPIINTTNNVNTICVDFVTDAVVRPLTLDSGIPNPQDHTFEWFEVTDPTTIVGTNSTYTVDTPSPGGATRSYAVHVTSTSPLGCDTVSPSFDVLQSGQATIPSGTLGYTVTNAFTQNQTIEVLIEGYGTYQYSLDDGPRQDSNVFENVSFGTHYITIWDNENGVVYSCDELVISNIQIIDFPRYFTPNGDGIHDTWNIVGLADQLNTAIYIFDRYGKLIKQISSAGAGWDGTFNGQDLPSDDYWFRVDYYEQNVAKQFKSHFSLKR